MTVALMPAYGRVTSATFRLEGNVGRFTSPLTRTEQTLVRPGARWSASYTLETKEIDGASAGQWISFLNQLEASGGLFYVNDPYRLRPSPFVDSPNATTCDDTGVTCDSGSDTMDEADTWGSPQVNGGGQSGSSLVTDGWAAGATVLLAGDYIAFDNGTFRELHQVTADAVSNGSGQATLSIVPPIHRSPADNARICVEGKDVGTGALMAAEMRLVPGSARFTGALPRLTSISFEAKESLR